MILLEQETCKKDQVTGVQFLDIQMLIVVVTTVKDHRVKGHTFQ